MNEDVVWICEKVANDRICPEGTKWYLFGSASRLEPTSSDIDLLVIYKLVGEPSLVRERIKHLELQRPLHVIFMTEIEERELDFISSERALEIFPSNKVTFVGK